MAYAYEKLGQLEKARLALEQVIARAPKPEPVAYVGLAAIAIQRSDLDAAAKSLRSAREAWKATAPSAAWYHYAGIEAAMRGDSSRALELLEEGTAHHRASAVLVNNLSVMKQAREAWRQAVSAGTGTHH
jgi:tetratricopeptide (TPR) repeat protein